MNEIIKHYIRLDLNNNIIHGFSDAFETPQNIDICINDNGERHFMLNGIENPNLAISINNETVYLYKWLNSELYIKTDSDISGETELLQTSQTDAERITQLEQLVADLASLQLGV